MRRVADEHQSRPIPAADPTGFNAEHGRLRPILQMHDAVGEPGDALDDAETQAFDTSCTQRRVSTFGKDVADLPLVRSILDHQHAGRARIHAACAQRIAGVTRKRQPEDVHELGFCVERDLRQLPRSRKAAVGADHELGANLVMRIALPVAHTTHLAGMLINCSTRALVMS